jgi:hypothetical protein
MRFLEGLFRPEASGRASGRGRGAAATSACALRQDASARAERESDFMKGLPIAKVGNTQHSSASFQRFGFKRPSGARGCAASVCRSVYESVATVALA